MLRSIVADGDARDRVAVMMSPRRRALTRAPRISLLLLSPRGVRKSHRALRDRGRRRAICLPDGGPNADGGRDARVDGDAPTLPDGPLPPIDAQPRDANRTDCPDADATLVYVVTTRERALQLLSRRRLVQVHLEDCVPRAARRHAVLDGRRSEGRRVRRVHRSAHLSREHGHRRVHRHLVPAEPAGLRQLRHGLRDERRRPHRDALRRRHARPEHARVAGPRAHRHEHVPAHEGRQLRAGHRARRAQRDRRRTTVCILHEGHRATARPRTSARSTRTPRAVIAETPFPTVDQGNGWAFAFWGGDFYMFTAPGGGSDVTRYRPTDNSVTVVATLPTRIVGAGVSTCAPSQ